MKTQAINWTNITVAEAAEIFKNTFNDVHILPNMDVLTELKKATRLKGELRELRLVENDDQYGTTTYSFESAGGLTLYAEIDAETGEAGIGSKR